jgi:cysteine desulfurase / selenocysteine lyase
MTDASKGLETIRAREFSSMKGAAYLNAASLGPIPERAREAMEAFNARRAEVQGMRDEDFVVPLQRTREGAARLIGASTNEIALIPSTSLGINVAALGLMGGANSTVVISDREFPANVYPWMARERFRLERVPVSAETGWPDEDRLLERVARGGVSILAVSSVQFDNGYTNDLAALGQACRASGTMLVVDAIQSLGQLPLNVGEIPADVIATAAHKWLCGPLGTGFLYVREAIQERLRPVVVGWGSVEGSRDIESLLDYDLSFVPDARRYEVGTLPLQDYAGFAKSLEVLLEADPVHIRDYVDDLLEPLRSWLRNQQEVKVVSPQERSRRSGIVSFRPPESRRVFRSLRAAGIVCGMREGSIRISAHLYNTSDDVDRVLDVLDRAQRGGWQ